MIREFLEADLVDTLHIAVSPIELGRGERLWDSPDDLLDADYYHPKERGFEARMIERWAWLRGRLRGR